MVAVDVELRVEGALSLCVEDPQVTDLASAWTRLRSHVQYRLQPGTVSASVDAPSPPEDPTRHSTPVPLLGEVRTLGESLAGREAVVSLLETEGGQELHLVHTVGFGDDQEVRMRLAAAGGVALLDADTVLEATFVDGSSTEVLGPCRERLAPNPSFLWDVEFPVDPRLDRIRGFANLEWFELGTDAAGSRELVPEAFTVLLDDAASEQRGSMFQVAFASGPGGERDNFVLGGTYGHCGLAFLDLEPGQPAETGARALILDCSGNPVDEIPIAYLDRGLIYE